MNFVNEIDKAIIRFRQKVHQTRDEEKIYEYAKGLVKEITAIFQLPDSIWKIYEEFEKMEAVLYLLPRYREHFLHQLHVFLTGYYIIKKWKEKGVKFLQSDEDLKNWFVASILHDVAYPAEMHDEWIPELFKKLFKISIKSQIDLKPILAANENLYHLLDMVPEQFEKYSKDRRNLFKKWTYNQLDRKDHGILCSLIIIELLKGSGLNPYIPALAVILHNYHKNIESQLSTLSAEDYLLAFFLVYCDTVQEWGRTIEESAKTDLKLYNISVANQETNCILEYQKKFSPSEFREKIEKLDGAINKLKNGWQHENITHSFRITIKDQQEPPNCYNSPVFS